VLAELIPYLLAAVILVAGMWLIIHGLNR